MKGRILSRPLPRQAHETSSRSLASLVSRASHAARHAAAPNTPAAPRAVAVAPVNSDIGAVNDTVVILDPGKRKF